MRRANAGASQHRNRQLRRHAHVNCNAITLLHPERLQDIGKLLHFTMKLLISKRTNLARLTLPDQRRFILAPSLNMAIKTVIGEIDLAPREPLGPRAVPLKNLVPFFEPMQFFCAKAGMSASPRMGIERSPSERTPWVPRL